MLTTFQVLNQTGKVGNDTFNSMNQKIITFENVQASAAVGAKELNTEIEARTALMQQGIDVTKLSGDAVLALAADYKVLAMTLLPRRCHNRTRSGRRTWRA